MNVLAGAYVHMFAYLAHHLFVCQQNGWLESSQVEFGLVWFSANFAGEENEVN